VKRHSLVLVAGLFLAASSGGAAQQSSERDAVTPRIGRLEQWFSAIASHRPGAVDEQVRLVNTWNQEQLHQIWIAVSTIVSLVREPDVSLFYVNEPSTRSGPGQQGQLSSLATSRSTQVLYTVGELRRIRALVKRVSPTGQPGPENDIVKRGALLHADIALLTPVASRADAVGNAFAEGASRRFVRRWQRGLGASASRALVHRRARAQSDIPRSQDSARPCPRAASSSSGGDRAAASGCLGD
jgi:hypothetical protein